LKVRSILGPATLLTAGRGTALAVSFLIPVVLARLLDQGSFGTYKQLFLVSSTIFLTMQIGMAESLFYFVPLDPKRGGAYVANSLATLAGTGVIAALAMSTASARIGSWLGNPQIGAYLPILALFVLFSMGAAGLEIVLTSRKRFLVAAITYCMSDLTKAACLLVPALLTRDLGWLLIGALVFSLMRLIAALATYHRLFPRALRPDASLLRAQLAYTLPLGSYVVIETLQTYVHQYAVSFRFDPAVFAIYAVGCLQIPIVELIASPSCNVMMVGMRDALQKEDAAGALDLWRDTTARLAILIVPIVALLLVASRDIILLLFTSRYEASVPIFRLWCCLLLMAVFQTDGVLRVFARTRFLLVLSIVKLVFVLTVIGFLLSWLGLRGAVLAALLSSILGRTSGLVKIARILKAPLRGFLPWGTLVAAAGASGLAAALAIFVRGTLSLPPIPALAVTAALFAATYGLCIAPAVTSWQRRPATGLIPRSPAAG
jgi:O-antigen/teichoic acid export membrane protein